MSVEAAPQSTKVSGKDKPQLQRHLRVVELPGPEYGPVKQFFVNRGRQIGLLDTPEPYTPDPEGVLISRGHFGIKGLRNLREEKAVGDAMIDLAAAGNQGTKIKHKRFEIWDEKERRWRGGVKKRKLRRRPFGWQKGSVVFGGLASMDARNKANLKWARKAEKKATGTGSFNMRDNPIEQALKEHRRAERRLKRADKKEVINGPFGWRAKWVAMVAEASPFSAKDELNVGHSRAQIYDHLSRMMARIGDAQLDPSDLIHGPFEAGVKGIHEAQEGFSGMITSVIAGRGQEKLNLGAAGIVITNKLLSPDARQSFIANLRSFGTLGAYFLFYQRKVHGKDWLKNPDQKPHKGWAWALPGLAVVETAIDRRANQHDVARFADVEALLRTSEIQNRLFAAHQRVVAEEFIRAYEAPPGVEGALQRGADRANQGLSWLTDKVGDVADKLPGIVPAKRVLDMLRSNTNDPHNDALIQEANDAYAAGEKISKKAHVKAILNYADRVLATNVTKVEKERWETAKKYARKFDAAYRRSVEIATPAAATQAPELELAPDPVPAAVTA